MIEKIEMPEMDETYQSAMFAKILGNKINELVEAVNNIQKEREAERFEIQEWIGILEAVRKSVNIHEKQIDELQMKVEPEKCETPDEFAEQRRWIGKACWFWDEIEKEKVFGILTTIDSDCGLTDACPYWNDATKNWYEHCEPVKDDIIYRGE